MVSKTTMEKTAHAAIHYLRMTPRKARAVANLIKNLPVSEAEAQLMNNPRRAGAALRKLLKSAVANAKNAKLSEEKLYVKSITVDQGPMLKRFLPRARGSATPIQKKMSHVTLTLAEGEKAFSARFKISTVKKVKTEKPKKSKLSTGEQSEKEPAAPRAKDRGFLKRIFRRKSGM